MLTSERRVKPERLAFWVYFSVLVGLLAVRSADPLSWIDEFGPVVMRGKTYAETLDILLRYGQHPPLFGLLIHWVMDTWGTSPFVLRLPALLPWIGATLIFRRLVTRTVSPLAGDAAALVFVMCGLAQSAAIMCRPYALAMLFAATALWCFSVAITSRHWVWAAGAVLSCLVAVTFHVLYIPLAVCGGVYAVFGLIQKNTDRKPHGAILLLSGVTLVFSFCMSWPLISRLWMKRDGYSYIMPPSPSTFLAMPGGAILIFVLSLLWCGRSSRSDCGFSRPIIGMVWSLLAVFWCGCFLLSCTSGVSVFIERHIGPMFFATSLAPFVFSDIRAVQRPFAFISACFLLVIFTQGQVFVRPGSDFSLAARQLARQAQPTDAVLFGSEYIESGREFARNDPFIRRLLYGPLRYYGYTGLATPLPPFSHLMGLKGTKIEASIIQDIRLINAPRVLLIGSFGSVSPYCWWIPLFNPIYRLKDWTDYGGTVIVEFERGIGEMQNPHGIAG